MKDDDGIGPLIKYFFPLMFVVSFALLLWSGGPVDRHFPDSTAVAKVPTPGLSLVPTYPAAVTKGDIGGRCPGKEFTSNSSVDNVLFYYWEVMPQQGWERIEHSDLKSNQL